MGEIVSRRSVREDMTDRERNPFVGDEGGKRGRYRGGW